MWVITKVGFFSVVEDKEDDSMVIVRAMCEQDAEALLRGLDVTCVSTEKPGVVHTVAGCYVYRVHCSKAGFARWTAKQAADVDYPHFQEAMRVINPVRMQSYRDAWDRFSSITLREDAQHGYPSDYAERAARAEPGEPTDY